MRRLETLRVRNFRSIRDQLLKLRNLNVFIGGNGSGKSNLIGAFDLLRHIASQELQLYVGRAGGANRLMHYGRKAGNLSIFISFREGGVANEYAAVLEPTADDRLVFATETYSYQGPRYSDPRAYPLGSGHLESRLREGQQEKVVAHVLDDLNRFRVYHFHDTSAGARVKQGADTEDNRILASDAGNLAAFLYRLKLTHSSHYERIEEAVRQIAPFFRAFDLLPSRLNAQTIRLEWRETDAPEMMFGPEALSDGTLRFICLATLLLQPELPSLIILDEPELGLHPAAIVLLAAMLSAAAERTQLLVATQSVTLVNQLEPADIWVAERSNGATEFRNLSAEDTAGWIDGYSLGELWEKNVIGGRP